MLQVPCVHSFDDLCARTA